MFYLSELAIHIREELFFSATIFKSRTILRAPGAFIKNRVCGIGLQPDHDDLRLSRSLVHHYRISPTHHGAPFPHVDNVASEFLHVFDEFLFVGLEFAPTEKFDAAFVGLRHLRVRYLTSQVPRNQSHREPRRGSGVAAGLC